MTIYNSHPFKVLYYVVYMCTFLFLVYNSDKINVIYYSRIFNYICQHINSVRC